MDSSLNTMILALTYLLTAVSCATNLGDRFGCTMHNYTFRDVQVCLRKKEEKGIRNNLVFLGDSRMRFLYQQFDALVRLDKYFNTQELRLRVFQNNAINDFNRTKLSFIWVKYVDELFAVYTNWTTKPADRPTLLVTDCGLWYFLFNEDWTDRVRANLTRLKPLFEPLKHSTKHLWTIQAPLVDAITSVTPHLLLSNAMVDKYNNMFIQILENSSVQLWHTYRKVGEVYYGDLTDGLHFQDGKGMSTHIQILLNYYCNDVMKLDDGTCCSQPKTSLIQHFTDSYVHLAMLAVFITSFFVLVVAIIWYLLAIVLRPHSLHGGWVDEVIGITANITRLGVMLLYCLICDRIKKQSDEEICNTHTEKKIFYSAVAIMTLIGCVWNIKTTKVTGVLYSEQTDDMKGWLQAVAMVYHITGTSHVLPHNMEVRLAVSTFLFLSGFGHFSRYFSTGCYSLQKFITVLVKYNLFVVLLCLLMDKPYQFYGFVSLISCWILVIYVIMTGWNPLPSKTITKYCATVVIKILFIIVLIEVGLPITSKVKFTLPWNESFQLATNFVYVWQLDIYMVFYGVVFACAVRTIKHLTIVDYSPEGEITTKLKSFLVIATTGLLVFFIILLRGCTSKTEYDDVVSFLGFIPAVFCLVVRNVAPSVRSRYNCFFSWIGQFSLEMYICQHHLLDKTGAPRGALPVIPGYPGVNIIVTTSMFVYAAHELHWLTLVF